MKNTKKIVSLISLILCFVLVLCCCGKNPTNNDTTSKPSQSDTNSDIILDEDDDWDDEDFDDEEDWGDEGFDDEEDWGAEDFDDEEWEDDWASVYDVEIDLSTPLSTNYMDSAVYLGWGYFPDANGRTYTKKEITAELDRIQKLGYKHLRTSLSTGWVNNGYINAEKDWDWDGEEFQNFVWICKELEKRGVTLSMTVNWEIMVDLRSSGIYVEGDYAATCENYGNYGVRLLKKLEENGVRNITRLIPFVETYPSRLHPGFTNKYTNEVWRDTVKALDKKLKAEGMRDRYDIIGPCTTLAHFQHTHDHNALGFTPVEWAEWVVENCNDFIDMHAFHGYSAYSNNVYEDTYQYFYDAIAEVLPIFKATGKPVLFDEFGYSYDDVISSQESTYKRYLVRNEPFYATQYIASLLAVVNNGADMTMRWSLFDTIFPDSLQDGSEFDNGIQITGIAPAMNESSIPYYDYYASSLVTRYFSGNGVKTYKGVDFGEGVYLAASENADGTFTVLAVNLNVSEAEVNFNFSKSLGKATLYRHLYDPATVKRSTAGNIIGVDKVFKNVQTTFTDVLPSGAVVVYTTNPN